MDRPTRAPMPSAEPRFKNFLRPTSIFVLAIPSSLEEKELLALRRKERQENESPGSSAWFPISHIPKHYPNAYDFSRVFSESCRDEFVGLRHLFCAERNLNRSISYWIVNKFRNVAWITAQFSIRFDLVDFEFLRRSLSLKTGIIALNLFYPRERFVRSLKDLNANRSQREVTRPTKIARPAGSRYGQRVNGR